MRAQPEEPGAIFYGIFKNQESLLNKWIEYADRQLRLHSKGNFAKCYTGECIVHQVIADTILGVLKWDRETVPEISVYMYMQIKSKIANIIKKERRLVFTDSLHGRDGDFADEAGSSNKNSFLDNNHFLSLTDFERQLDSVEFIEMCRKELESDENAAIIFEYMVDNLKNSETAKELGITVREVEAAKARIRRKVRRGAVRWAWGK